MPTFDDDVTIVVMLLLLMYEGPSSFPIVVVVVEIGPLMIDVVEQQPSTMIGPVMEVRLV